MIHGELYRGTYSEFVPSDIARRLARPPCMEDITDPELMLGSEYRSSYSDMVDAGFTRHIGMMALLDSVVPFATRLQNPRQAYALYRAHVPEPHPGYWDTIDSFTENLGPVPDRVDLTSFISAGLEQESTGIYDSLTESLANSTTSEHEAILFLNTFGKHPDREQQTHHEIARFRRDNPGVALKTFEHTLEHGEALSGIKKIAADVVVTRWARSGAIDRPGYAIVQNDADTTYAASDYLPSYQSALTEHHGIMMARQVFDFDHEAYRCLGPEFVFGVRVRQFIRRQLDANSGNFYPEGFDMAMRPQLYCAMGGFMPGLTYGEDYPFGKLFLYYMGGLDTVALVRPERIGIHTSARRPAFSHINNIASGTNTRAFADINFALRTQQGYPTLTSDQPIEQRLEADMQRVGDYFLSAGLHADHSIFINTFRNFGVDAVREDGRFVVKDASAFCQAYDEVFGDLGHTRM